jgi:hypothetical protein
MKHLCAAIFFVLLGTGLATAQIPPPSGGAADETVMHGSPNTTPNTNAAKLALTGAQKAIIQQNVRQEGGKATSSINFVVEVGAPVPPSLELYLLPDRALSAVPEAKIVKYTLVQNKIVLVDPTNMRVVDVIDL